MVRRNAPCFTECWLLKTNLLAWNGFNDMKLLIGYDGSKCADDALDALKYAGLPRKAETTVLCIAEVSPLTPIAR